MRKVVRNTVGALFLLLQSINVSSAQRVDRHVSIERVVLIKPGTPSLKLHRRTSIKRGFVWIDGHYKWNRRSKSYVWVEGHQIRQKKGKMWVSGKWRRVPGGWTYTPGFWA